MHIDNIETFLGFLGRVRQNFSRWRIADKKEHAALKKKALTVEELQRLLAAEAEAAEIDINKIHILFDHYKKEKINILRDLEILRIANV